MDAAWEQTVRSGDAVAAGELLQAGADVNARNRHGQTALMIAAKNGHIELIKVLLAAGADCNVTAKYNLNALMLAVLNGHEEVAKLLAQAGTQLGQQGSGAPGFSGKTAYDLAADRNMQTLLPHLK